MISISRCIAIVGSLVCAGALGEQAFAQTPLTASPKFRAAIGQARSYLDAGDLVAAGSAVSALPAASPLERYMAASLALELAVKRGDMATQRQSIRQMLDSGAAPDGQLAHLNHIAGYLAWQANAVDEAIAYLTRARSLGETSPRASLLLVESYVRRKKLDDAARVLGETIAARRQSGETVPVSWYDRAASLAYTRKDWTALANASAAKLGDQDVGAPAWRSAIAAYMAGAQPEKEAELDLYRLQAAAGAMASERDYQAYASLAAAQGYAAEARAVIEAGKAAGRLTAGDPVTSALLRPAKGKKAKGAPPAKPSAGKAAAEQGGASAARKGDDLLATGDYGQAATYYRTALQKGVADTDRVTARLGIALARSGDLDGGRTTLTQAKGRWGDVAVFWSAWIDANRVRSGAAPGAAAGSSSGAPTTGAR